MARQEPMIAALTTKHAELMQLNRLIIYTRDAAEKGSEERAKYRRASRYIDESLIYIEAAIGALK